MKPAARRRASANGEPAPGRRQRLGPHGQGQLDLRATRDAHVLALDPVRPSRQHDLRARLEMARGLEDDREQHLAFVPVAHQRRGGDPKRGRPLDRPRHETVRQPPAHLRRQARVSRVLPVGVPAALHLEPQPDGDRLPGLDPRALGDERGLDVARAEGQRRLGKGRERRHRPATRSASPAIGGGVGRSSFLSFYGRRPRCGFERAAEGAKSCGERRRPPPGPVAWTSEVSL